MPLMSTDLTSIRRYGTLPFQSNIRKLHFTYRCHPPPGIRGLSGRSTRNTKFISKCSPSILNLCSIVVSTILLPCFVANTVRPSTFCDNECTSVDKVTKIYDFSTGYRHRPPCELLQCIAFLLDFPLSSSDFTCFASPFGIIWWPGFTQ